MKIDGKRPHRLGAASFMLAAASLGAIPPAAFGDLRRREVTVTEDELAFLKSLDRGGLEIWTRRFKRGLSDGERAFVRKRGREIRLGGGT